MKAVVFHEFGGPDVLQLEDRARSEPGPGRGPDRRPRLRAQPSRRRRPRGHLPLPGRAAVHPRDRGRRPDRRARRGRRRLAGRRARDAVPDGDLRRLPLSAGPAASRSARHAGFISFSTSGGYAEQLACSTRHLMRVPGRALRRGRRGAPDRVRDGLAHALHARQPRGRRDGDDQLGRQRHRLGGRPARAPRGRDRDRQRLLRREARARGGARAWITASTTPTQDVVAEVMRLTGDRGVDLVFEHVGGELFQKGLDSLGKDGRLVICGGALRRGRPVRHHPVLPRRRRA